MTVRRGVKPLGNLLCPWQKNKVLLDIRHDNPDTLLEDILGRIFLYSGRYLLELVSGGGSGSGWQDGNVWSGGAGGSAIKLKLKLPACYYDYQVGGATSESGLMFCGGTGRDSFFKTASSDDRVKFYLTGGIGAFGVGGRLGGTVRDYSERYVLEQLVKADGNLGMGWSNRPGGVSPGGASVYPVDGFPFGAGGGTLLGGIQGFLRLTWLGE